MQEQNKKLRIIVCSNMYPPNFVGGAELIAHYQAKELVRQGHDVIIFAGDTKTVGERHSIRMEMYDSIQVYRIHLVAKDYECNYNNFVHSKVEEHFENLINNFQPDVVHFHNIIGLSVKIIGIAKNRGIRTVLTVHDHWGYCFKNTIMKANGEICKEYNNCENCMPIISDDDKNIPMRMRKDFLKYQLNHVDFIISPSQYLADSYIKSGIPKEKVKVIWNGVDIDRFSKVAKVVNTNVVRFTYVGYFGAHKGISTLLEALAILDCKESVRINLVGSGDQEENYRMQLRALNCEHLVKFWGKVDNSDIEKVYAETDVLVLPSIWPENQPVSITEAMACGIPIIASRMGGNVELVEDRVTGFLFTAKDSKELAENMKKFASDPERIYHLGSNALKKISRNGYKNQVENIVKLYETNLLNYSCAYNIIMCVGERVDSSFSDALERLSTSCFPEEHYFLMKEWLLNKYLKGVKLICVTDPNVKLEDISFAIKNCIPVIVPDANEEVKQYCLITSSGFYYTNPYELETFLRYYLYDKRIQATMINNIVSYLSNI